MKAVFLILVMLSILLSGCGLLSQKEPPATIPSPPPEVVPRPAAVIQADIDNKRQQIVDETQKLQPPVGGLDLQEQKRLNDQQRARIRHLKDELEALLKERDVSLKFYQKKESDR